MASIKKRTRNRAIDYRVFWRERGTQKTKSFARFADAKAFQGLMEDNERRRIGDPQKQKTGEFLDRWLTGLRERGEHSPVTLDSYGFCIKRLLPTIGDIPLGRLGTADIDAAYAGLRARGIAASTIGLVHCTLHSAFEQARKWKLVPENPASDASPPRRVQSRSRAFAVEEVGRLLAAAEPAPRIAHHRRDAAHHWTTSLRIVGARVGRGRSRRRDHPRPAHCPCRR
jgi:integrase